MRPVVSAVLSFAFFVSAATAQSNEDKLLAGIQAIADHLKADMPTALYECDSDQCENPNSGGALWLFEGKQGQGMWLYEAAANLTVEQFDGHSIHIHRADPVGTYSSQFVGGKEFFADYYGTIEGDTIRGRAFWNGTRDNAPWRATIVNEKFCDDGAPKCPLRADQLSVLGRRATEAKLYGSAYRCFRIAALAKDADGEAFVATMIMNGWGAKLTPPQILALLQDSAGRDSYAGEQGLAQAFRDGVIVAKDDKQAAYWSERASSWQSRREAEENARMQGRVLTQITIFDILKAALTGSDDDNDAVQRQRDRLQQEHADRIRRAYSYP